MDDIIKPNYDYKVTQKLDASAKIFIGEEGKTFLDVRNSLNEGVMHRYNLWLEDQIIRNQSVYDLKRIIEIASEELERREV